jgi:hypothetical protein
VDLLPGRQDSQFPGALDACLYAPQGPLALQIGKPINETF